MKREKIVDKSKKRRGRGYGSGKGGHTTGRGQKGQKSRGSIGVVFEGFKVRKSLIKRLPQIRGKMKNKPGQTPVIVNLQDLEKLPAGSKITIDLLIKNDLVDEREARKRGVKILGKGNLKKKMSTNLPMSEKAAKKIDTIKKEEKKK
jgi:large subunit ribosomal protein L15